MQRLLPGHGNPWARRLRFLLVLHRMDEQASGRVIDLSQICSQARLTYSEGMALARWLSEAGLTCLYQGARESTGACLTGSGREVAREASGSWGAARRLIANRLLSSSERKRRQQARRDVRRRAGGILRWVYRLQATTSTSVPIGDVALVSGTGPRSLDAPIGFLAAMGFLEVRDERLRLRPAGVLEAKRSSDSGRAT
jgi:hypothetical protein